MAEFGVVQQHLTTIGVDGKSYNVSVRIAFDGIEYIGRLWFAEALTNDTGIPDHGAIPGRTVDEAVVLAKRLTADDLVRRYHRARADKRRYMSLRRAVDDILTKVKYMNRVAVTMRSGMIDKEGANQEIDLIQQQLHEVVDRLKGAAGVED
ncbi:MAG: hypothetical protein H0U64_02510 [Gemmatimonadaceae bacterium]|nr:hypothetical protein [Gemmatimonadaceae bacterium]